MTMTDLTAPDLVDAMDNVGCLWFPGVRSDLPLWSAALGVLDARRSRAIPPIPQDAQRALVAVGLDPEAGTLEGSDGPLRAPLALLRLWYAGFRK